MNRLLTVVVASGLAVAACSDDPTSSDEYQELEQQLAAAEQRIEEPTAERGVVEQKVEDFEADRVGSDLMEKASFPAVPANAVVVVATVDCFDTEGEAEVDEEVEGAVSWLWMCEIDASDSRVSGIERHADFRWLAQSSDGVVWLVEDATITNEEGSWRGVALGADSGGPVQGEAHYVGEGAYEGLEYHYYLADLGGGAVETRGWISSDG